MTTWKAVERAIAKVLRGTRIPVSGRQRGDSADIEHPFFSVEVKHRETLPDWILDALDQAKKSKRGSRIPLAVLHGKGMKYEESLAFMELRDIMAMYDRIEKLEEKLSVAVEYITTEMEGNNGNKN